MFRRRDTYSSVEKITAERQLLTIVRPEEWLLFTILVRVSFLTVRGACDGQASEKRASYEGDAPSLEVHFTGGKINVYKSLARFSRQGGKRMRPCAMLSWMRGNWRPIYQ